MMFCNFLGSFQFWVMLCYFHEIAVCFELFCFVFLKASFYKKSFDAIIRFILILIGTAEKVRLDVVVRCLPRLLSSSHLLEILL